MKFSSLLLLVAVTGSVLLAYPPWTREIRANSSNRSESSAVSICENNLGWKIDEAKAECEDEFRGKGTFSVSETKTSCSKTGYELYSCDCRVDAKCWIDTNF
jgi:hypothetical protein